MNKKGIEIGWTTIVLIVLGLIGLILAIILLSKYNGSALDNINVFGGF